MAWSDHVEALTSEVNQRLGMLTQISHLDAAKTITTRGHSETTYLTHFSYPGDKQTNKQTDK